MRRREPEPMSGRLKQGFVYFFLAGLFFLVAGELAQPPAHPNYARICLCFSLAFVIALIVHCLVGDD